MQPQHNPHIAPIFGVEVMRLVGMMLMLWITLLAWSIIGGYWMLWAGISAMIGVSMVIAVKRCIVARSYKKYHDRLAYEAQTIIFGKQSRLGELTDAFVQNLRGRSGIFLGALDKSLLFVNLWSRELGGALTVYGPAGTGKTSTIIMATMLNIWNLLGKNRLKFSVWITDPKGEIYRVCAPFRRWCGRRVITLCPFPLPGIKQNFFNALDCILRSVIERTGETRNLCSLIANCLIPEPEGNKGETDNSFFRKAAKLLLMRLMVYMAVFEPFQCHLPRLRQLVSGSEAELMLIANKMKDCDQLNGLVRNYGERMLDEMPAKNFKSIRQECEQALDIYDEDSDFTNTLKRSDFTLEEMLDENTDVYVILPPDKYGTHGGYTALVSTLMIETIARHPKPSKFLMLMDEIGTMPRIPTDTIKKAFCQLRSQKLRMATFWQSESQMLVYGKDIATIIKEQSSVLIGWSIRDPDTAKQFSRKVGETTVKQHSYSQDPQQIHYPWKYNTSEKLEPILSETEILQLPSDKMLVCVADEKALVARRIPFWKIALMRRCAQKNPSEPFNDYPPEDIVEWQY